MPLNAEGRRLPRARVAMICRRAAFAVVLGVAVALDGAPDASNSNQRCVDFQSPTKIIRMNETRSDLTMLHWDAAAAAVASNATLFANHDRVKERPLKSGGAFLTPRAVGARVVTEGNKKRF